MAIQVNGTTVIDNSRNLTNIASVDATTAAAIGAAGVGGSDVTFTAAETISAGNSVGLNADGTISKALKTSIDNRLTTNYTSIWSSDFYSYGGVDWVQESGYFIGCGPSSLSVASAALRIACFKANSDGTVTNWSNYVSPFNVYSSYQVGTHFCTDGQGNYAGVIRYAEANSGSPRCAIVTFTISGTTISNLGYYQVSTNVGYIVQRVAAYDNNKFIAVWRNGNGFLSYTTFYRNGSSVGIYQNNQSLGAQTGGEVLPLALHGYTNATIPAGKVVIGTVVKNNANSTWAPSNNGAAAFGGTTLTINSSGVVSIGTTTVDTKYGYQGIADYSADPESKLINALPMTDLGYFYIGSDYSYYAKMLFQKASSSSDTITFIDGTTATPWANNGAHFIDTEANVRYFIKSNSTKFNVLPLDEFDNDKPSTSLGIAGTYQTDAGTSGLYYQTSGIKYGYMFKYRNNHVYIFSGPVGNLVSFFSIAQTSGTSGQSIKVAPLGTVSDVHSGLTIGKPYGVSNTAGGVSQSGSPNIGFAISSSEILVGKNSA